MRRAEHRWDGRLCKTMRERRLAPGTAELSPQCFEGRLLPPTSLLLFRQERDAAIDGSLEDLSHQAVPGDASGLGGGVDAGDEFLRNLGAKNLDHAVEATARAGSVGITGYPPLVK